MIKRIASVLLILAMLAVSVPFTASAATSYTKTVSDYNGTRYENYLVVYNKGTTTGTNAYGYEVTVTDGIVTSIGGNNSTIPENGYVVSGHGTMRDWLADNIIVGMSVTLNTTTNKITFVFDDETRMRAINLSREAMLAAKQDAITACLVYDSNADTRFAEVEAEYEEILKKYNKGTAPTEAKCFDMIEKYDELATLYSERAVSEYRGVWIRPTQTTYTEVENYVKRCYNAGLNMISVETMYHGSMIYPTPKGSLIKHNPAFGGFDVLGAYIEACHKYGMELHVWMPVFYSCNSAESNWRISVAYKKPEWRAISNNGKDLYSGESTGMVFLNPALPEVQEYLIETYTYLLETYDIDGFQLDYIRYRDRTDTEDFGYDDYTISEFKKAYPQYASYDITYNTDAAYWKDWASFRADYITNFVYLMRNLIDRVAPDVLLTADVGPEPKQATANLYQNYPQWLGKDLLDMIHPMAYGSGYSLTMKNFFRMAGDRCLVVPGLGAYMEEFNAADMVSQTRDMLEVGCDGVVYFEASSFLSKGCGTALTENLFTEHAIAPALDIETTFEANLNRIKDRVAQAKSAGTISSSIATKLNNLIDSALACERPADAKDTLSDLAIAVQEVSNTLLCNRLAEDVVRVQQAINFDLHDSASVFELLGDKVYSDGYNNFIILGNGEAVPALEEISSTLLGGKVVYGTKTLQSGDALFTGAELTNGIMSFTIVVKGDVSGDGKVTALDYIKVKRCVLKTIELDTAEYLAADVHSKEGVNAFDYVRIKRHVLKTYNIYE